MNFSDTEAALVKKLTDYATGLQVPTDNIVVGKIGEIPAMASPFIAIYTAPYAGKKYESGKVEGAMDTTILCSASAEVSDVQAHKSSAILLTSRILNLLTAFRGFELKSIDIFSISMEDCKIALEGLFWGVDYYEDLYTEED